MPPRLNKRQQREQEELASLQVQHPADGSDSDDADEQQSPVKSTSLGFAALSAPDEIQNEDEGDDDTPAKSNKKSKKKKKKESAPTQVQIELQSSRQVTPSPQTVSKKADKKARARKKKAEDQTFETVLAELSLQYPDMQGSSPSSSSQLQASNSIARLLAVSLSHLNSDTELRKFFGSKVVDANKPQPTISTGRRRRRVIVATEVPRSTLTMPKPEWTRAKQQREGLSARSLNESEIAEKNTRRGLNTDIVSSGSERDVWWTIECSKRYKRLTRRFMQVVASGDPAAFYQILWNFPWHVDTILQQAEIARHREEHSVASELLSRALFSYELPLQLSPFSFTSGLNRLDFDHVENRPFFLALHRHIIDITRRGLLRTGFEFSKLLYALDPWEDPHGASLWLDWLSVKAGMGDWFLDIFDWFEKGSQDKANARINLSVLPGWLYTKALILKQRELDAEKRGKQSEIKSDSSRALIEAINNFPQIVPLLADKLDISLPTEKRCLPQYRIYTDSVGLKVPESIAHLLSHLYVQRAHGVWKDPSISKWFCAVATTTTPSSIRPRYTTFQSIYSPSSGNPNLSYSIYRHVTVYLQSSATSSRSLMSFIPSTDPVITSSLACDPVPPATRVTAYDSEFFKDVEWGASPSDESDRERAGRALRIFQRLFGGDARQIQPLVAQNPEIADLLEAINAGEVDLVEVLNDAMIQAAQADEGVAPLAAQPVAAEEGAMPGGDNLFHGMDLGIDFDEEEQEDNGDSDDENEEDDSAPFQMIRNVLSRFWGGFGGGNTTSNDDSEGDETA